MRIRTLLFSVSLFMSSLLFSAPSGKIRALIIDGYSNHEWSALFDGSSLDGWSVKCTPPDKQKTYWSVNHGAIECNSLGDPDHHYVWLATDREFGDFQLRLKFQVYQSSSGNSGVQFRSRYDDSDTALFGGWLNGPQADIDPRNPFRAGLIYDETNRVRRWIHPSLPDWKIEVDQAPSPARSTKLFYADDDPEAWNTMEIICEGMHIKTFVNGFRVTDFDAEGILDDAIHAERNVGTKGHIALQLHSGNELMIRFKDLFIREL